MSEDKRDKITENIMKYLVWIAFLFVLTLTFCKFDNKSEGSQWNHNIYSEAQTFTPTIIGSTTAGTQTYVANGQVGYYAVVGNIVFFDIRVQISAKDAAMAGDVLIGGLPFASKTATSLTQSCTIGSFSGVTYSGGAFTQLVALIGSGQNYITLRKTGSGLAFTGLPVGDIANATIFMVSGFYFK